MIEAEDSTPKKLKAEQRIALTLGLALMRSESLSDQVGDLKEQLDKSTQQLQRDTAVIKDQHEKMAKMAPFVPKDELDKIFAEEVKT